MPYFIIYFMHFVYKFTFKMFVYYFQNYMRYVIAALVIELA